LEQGELDSMKPLAAAIWDRKTADSFGVRINVLMFTECRPNFSL
jgi:hypothetical protein